MPKSNVIHLAIGIAIGISTTLLLGAGAEPPSRNTTRDDGRFQMIMGEKHAFILDTGTGRAWQYSLIQGAIENTTGFFNAKIKE